MKKRLTPSEEFEIMKIVLDKFLWLGVIIMGLGLYDIFKTANTTGLSLIIIGAIILVIFLVLVVKEYEIVR